MKKSPISHWSESDENAKWLRDCLWLCQACKRGFTCRPMERNLRQEAHSYPQADIDRYLLSPFTATSVTSNKIAGLRGAPQASYDRRRHRNCFQTGPAQAFPKKYTSLEVRGQLMRSNQYRASPASIYIYRWVDRSTCLASRISTEKESFPGSGFKPACIWTCWMLIDRQMQSAFMPELHRWISNLTARHLHHQDIFWSPGMVKEAVFCTKMSSKNEKKSYLSLIWKWWKREMTARLPVTVSSVQTWFYMSA